MEIIGFQEISNNPKFVVEDKPNNSDLNFFLNGGTKYDNYEGLEPIFKTENTNDYQGLMNIGHLLTSVVKIDNVVDVLFDDISMYKNIIIKESSELPFHFLEDATNIFLNNVSIISRANGIYSFRRHSATIIIEK